MAERNGTMAADVCVVGAGPVGGALACRLAAAGVATVIVDRAKLPPMEHPDFDGRAYAISAGSRPLLDAARLWGGLPFPPCPILDIRVSDGRVGRAASKLFLHFDYREAGGDAAEAGPFGWIIEARALRMALNRRLHELPALSVFAPADISLTRTEAGARVQIAGGPAIDCRLVVAADGRGSRLRQEAGIPVTRLPYRQSGVVCAIGHEHPHRNVALEHFLPGGPFAQLPMSGTETAPHVSAIVFTDRSALAERLMSLDDAGFTREVARRLGGHLGAIRLLGRRWCYPLSAQYAARYADTRLALVGDSAHAIHPIAGQGLNLGLRDAEALAGLVLEAAGHGQDVGSPALLTRYQRRRRPANLLMLGATDTLDRLFSTDDRRVRAIRDIGIAAVHRMPRLKRMFMRQAMGL